MVNKYVSEFLSLRCSGDVLNVVSPLGHKAQKEITESMAMIRLIKRVVLKKPMQYNLIDLCAGNALTSVLSVFYLPVRSATAIDIKPRSRQWGAVKRFEYQTADIRKIDSTAFTENDVLISVHPCGELARTVIQIWQNSDSRHLFLMPCCVGSFKRNSFLKQKIGLYLLWCLHLAEQCSGDLIEDADCLSPKNTIITANKK